MQAKRLLTAAALLIAALFILDVPAAQADTHVFQEVTDDGSGNYLWQTAGNWDLNAVPVAGDEAEIRTGLTAVVRDTADICGYLDIQGTGEVVIEANAKLTIDGNGTARTSTIAENARLYLEDSGAKLAIVDDSHTLSGDGKIVGQNSSARIEIAHGLTLTSNITIEGALTIDDAPKASATFANNGLVHANRTSADWVLTVATATINDSSGNRWQVSANEYAVLRFSSAATGLEGRFDVDNGTLDIDADVTTTGDLDFQGGKIEVYQNTTFQAS